MKRLIWYGATALLVGVGAAISDQSEVPNDSSSNSSYIQTSKLVGRKVKSSAGTEIGVVKDVVIDRTSGCMAYTVVSTGGAGTDFTSGGGKLVAIPWAVYSPTSDLSILTVNVAREKISRAEPFEYTRMDEYARPDFVSNIYSYYGVNPGPRTPVAAGTDVTGTAGATASPGEVASPAAGGTGSPNKTPSARMHASSAASSNGAPSANRSPKTIRSARSINARSSIDRGETASPATTEKFPSENTTSPNENKKSPRKAIEGMSIRRPSTTPQSAEGQY
jgi:sporulation protein YlmC with PRC-barrel domain